MTEDPVILGFAFVAFLVSGVVKGAMGIGQLTVAVAILGTVVGLRDAVPLMIAPALAANLWQVARGGPAGALLRRLWPMNLAGCIGIWLGTVILFAVDPLIMGAALGVVVCLWSALGFSRFSLTVPRAREAWLSPLAGFVSGTVSGATGSLHLLLVPYFQAMGLARDDFIRATGMSFLAAALIWATALVERGALDGTTALLSLAALIPTFAGIWVGAWMRGRVSEAVFRNTVFAGLIVLGLNLIRKGAF